MERFSSACMASKIGIGLRRKTRMAIGTDKEYCRPAERNRLLIISMAPWQRGGQQRQQILPGILLFDFHFGNQNGGRDGRHRHAAGFGAAVAIEHFRLSEVAMILAKLASGVPTISAPRISSSGRPSAIDPVNDHGIL